MDKQAKRVIIATVVTGAFLGFGYFSEGGSTNDQAITQAKADEVEPRVEDCATIQEDQERLACYDSGRSADTQTSDSRPDEDQSSNSEPAIAPPPESAWVVSQSTSPIDDSRTVNMSVHSSESIRDRYGREGYATLFLRCRENTTSMILAFADQHMADLNQYGQVTLRIDDQQARTVRMNESTDNRALGLWNGGRSIPVIQQMFGHDTLTVRATPYGESPITTQFPITGLEAAIEPLREACHW